MNLRISRFVPFEINAPLTLSIIIVNYNVKYFLEQCLYSLQRAERIQEAEIIIVDNKSTDGSVGYLKPKFSAVKFICNDANKGFAHACNQGLSIATGEYILFLNPDTIIAENTLSECLQFFSANKEAGALGIRMIDGKGIFLKESKRAFPGPVTSLFKLFGFSRAFPKSKIFSRYHLGHLDENETHEVDVLAGAFIMVRKEVLQKVGSFDEAFFMYGEDVDLSYRIQKAGYKNYYFAGATIIHFKGESTKRGSLNYVRMFYSAMSHFVKKHYGGSKASLFNKCIQFAIWMRAGFSAAAKAMRFIGLPVIDALLILLSFWLVKEVWTTVVRPDIVYPDHLIWIALPSFAAVYLFVAYYAGLYNDFYRKGDLLRSTFVATLVLLAAYALLPERFRFSRGIIVFGALLAFVFIAIIRKLLVQTTVLQKAIEKETQPYILIAGTKEEFSETKKLLDENNLSEKIIGRIAVEGDEEGSIANLSNIYERARTVNAREIIFCCGHLSYKQIMTTIQTFKNGLRIRFHAAGSGSIVGSDSSGTSGQVLSVESPFNLAQAHYRRLKRGIDGLSALLLLITFPVHLFFINNRFSFLKNCAQVLFGRKTWIGYALPHAQLPKLREGVLIANGYARSAQQILPATSLQLLDYWYAQDYRPMQDIATIYKNYKQLGS